MDDYESKYDEPASKDLEIFQILQDNLPSSHSISTKSKVSKNLAAFLKKDLLNTTY